MKCPECGAEFPVTAERCPCGYVFADSPRWSLYKGTDDDVHPASRRLGPFRLCAKCGSVMVLCRVEQMYIKSWIPAGKRLYFQCGGCGKEIKVRSLWRNLLALSGCFLFAFNVVMFASSRHWLVGVVAAILAYCPLVLLFEIVTRIRYPSVAAPDTAAGDDD